MARVLEADRNGLVARIAYAAGDLHQNGPHPRARSVSKSGISSVNWPCQSPCRTLAWREGQHSKGAIMLVCASREKDLQGGHELAALE